MSASMSESSNFIIFNHFSKQPPAMPEENGYLHSRGEHLRRLETQDLEIGTTDALQRHVTRHVIPPKPVSQRKLNFEHKRPRM
jgi:hypothetical protein